MCTLMTHLFFNIYVLQLQNRREYGREEIGEEYLALSAGAYTTTLLVMVHRVKGGGGVHPPPSPGWAEFTMECTQEWSLPVYLYTLVCGLKNFTSMYVHSMYSTVSILHHSSTAQ